MAKKSGAFLDEWGREKAKERYATGGGIGYTTKNNWHGADAVGGPATDEDLNKMEEENSEISKKSGTEPPWRGYGDPKPDRG